MAELKDWRTGIAPIEGARLYYEIAGQGHPVVLVHAGIADCRMWDDQFSMLAQHHRVVRYDMRGFGKSVLTPGPFSHRQDLYRLLKFLGIQPVHILGCSMGSLTSIDFALEYPQQVASLILVAPAISGYQFQGEPSQPLLELIAARQAGEFHRAADLQVQIWVDGPQRGPHQVDAHLRERVRQMSLEALANQGSALAQTGFVAEPPLQPPAVERLGAIDVPTLVIIGDQDDASVSAAAEALVAGIDGARKATITGTAHLPNMEHPEAFNQMVSGFLQEL
jgi:3-oxoadipate enol-lactonase